MALPKIGVIFDPWGASALGLHEAVGDLAEVVWIVRDNDDGGRVSRVLLDRMGSVVDVSSGDFAAAAESLRRVGIDGIIAFSDHHLVLASEIGQRLDLPGYPSDVATTVSNKFRQRRALDAGNVAQPKFWHLPSGLSPDELRHIASTVSYPAMVKRVASSGSQGVTRVDSALELGAAYLPELEQLAEEFMLEEECQDIRFSSHVAVDSAVTDAGISHAHVRGNLQPTDDFMQTAGFIPARIDEARTKQVLDLVADGIRALGITHSMVHTDVVITDAGPRIIEVNGRVSGDAPDYLRLISDVNLRRTAVEVALGRPVKFEALVPVRGVGFVCYCNPPLSARTVGSISGTEELTTSPWIDSVRIRARVGESVIARGGTFGVVRVVGHTANHDELLAAVDLINQTVEIGYGV
jgi:biotin carboxylase